MRASTCTALATRAIGGFKLSLRFKTLIRLGWIWRARAGGTVTRRLLFQQYLHLIKADLVLSVIQQIVVEDIAEMGGNYRLQRIRTESNH